MLPYSLRQTAVPLRLQSFLSYISFAEIYLFFCFLRSCLKTIYISNKCNSDQITLHNFLSFPYPPVYQIPALCTQKHVLCRKKSINCPKRKNTGNCYSGYHSRKQLPVYIIWQQNRHKNQLLFPQLYHIINR